MLRLSCLGASAVLARSVLPTVLTALPAQATTPSGAFTAVVERLLTQDDVSYRELEALAEAAGVEHERTMESIPVVPT